MKTPNDKIIIKRFVGEELNVKELLDKLIPIYVNCCKGRGDSSV